MKFENTMRIAVIVLFIVLIVGFSFYYFANVYSFRNYGEGGNWEPLIEYHFETNKVETEKRMTEIMLTDSSTMKCASKDCRFSKDGWTTLLIKGNSFRDSTEYIFRFKGDSLNWATNPKSQIMLFGIADQGINITPTTINQNDDSLVKIKLSLFENNFINRVKKKD